MIEAKLKEVNRNKNEYYLSINGINDINSWCFFSDNKLSGALYCENAIREFVNMSFSRISNNVRNIQVHSKLEFKWTDRLDFEFIFIDFSYDRVKAPAVKVELNIDFEEWSNLLSIYEYASLIEDVIIDLQDPHIEYFQDEEFVTNGFGFIFKVFDTDKRIKEVVSEVEIKLKKVESLLETEIMKKMKSNSLNMIFNFPEDIRVPCEQYLQYFAQFIKDLGINVKSDLKHEASKTLFSVIPDNNDEALKIIQEALSIYLNMSTDLDIEYDFEGITNFAANQYKMNLYYLRSQLTQANATIDAKNETLNLLKSYRLSEMINQEPPKNEQNEEKILGGIIGLGKIKLPGGSIDLGLGYRCFLKKLKRKQ